MTQLNRLLRSLGLGFSLAISIGSASGGPNLTEELPKELP